MKIQVILTWLCHGMHSSPVSCSSFLIILLFILILLLISSLISSVRVLGVTVLSRWPVPTLTHSLTLGHGIESQDHWKAM